MSFEYLQQPPTTAHLSTSSNASTSNASNTNSNSNSYYHDHDDGDATALSVQHAHAYGGLGGLSAGLGRQGGTQIQMQQLHNGVGLGGLGVGLGGRHGAPGPGHTMNGNGNGVGNGNGNGNGNENGHGNPNANAHQIQFQLPDYLYDAPPTLAPGGGAEVFHPAVAQAWFQHSGFAGLTMGGFGGGGQERGYDEMREEQQVGYDEREYDEQEAGYDEQQDAFEQQEEQDDLDDESTHGHGHGWGVGAYHDQAANGPGTGAVQSAYASLGALRAHFGGAQAQAQTHGQGQTPVEAALAACFPSHSPPNSSHSHSPPNSSHSNSNSNSPSNSNSNSNKSNSNSNGSNSSGGGSPTFVGTPSPPQGTRISRKNGNGNGRMLARPVGGGWGAPGSGGTSGNASGNGNLNFKNANASGNVGQNANTSGTGNFKTPSPRQGQNGWKAPALNNTSGNTLPYLKNTNGNLGNANGWTQHQPALNSRQPALNSRQPALNSRQPALTTALPVYSQSGFDVVALLSRVQRRPHPQIRLGPVDFTTSFVVVDVRRHDDPIVYCSPNFCGLTGYAEREVLGRNCRFLQAPPAGAPQYDANGSEQQQYDNNANADPNANQQGNNGSNGDAAGLAKGDERRHTSAAAVRQLAKAVAGRKEVQVSVVNYRKDGSAFVNLVSVVPLCGEFADVESVGDYGKARSADVVWYVGFQIDLTAQSEGIVARVREGTYYAGAVRALEEQEEREAQAQQQKAIEAPPPPGGDHTGTSTAALANAANAKAPAPLRERRTATLPAPRMSAALARLLGNPAFLASCGVQGGAVAHSSHALAGVAGGPGLGMGMGVGVGAGGNMSAAMGMTATATATTAGMGVGANVPMGASANVSGGVTSDLRGLPPDPASHALHALLLEQLPDFVHVVSLKGAFLYAAPAVTRVLGWAPAELVGRALADVCFAGDVVAVGRALKEASLPVEGARIMEVDAEDKGAGPAPTETLRTVDLVFRARTKSGAWVWVECRGRLHVEPGKGRKAIVLVGRARGMARVGDVWPPSPTLAYRSEYNSPQYQEYPPSQQHSPAGSASELEWALRPTTKRARTQDNLGAGAVMRHSSTSLTSPALGVSEANSNGTVANVFHGLLDPHGMLISVGDGVRTLLGWEPLELLGTRLGALVVPDTRLSAAGRLNLIDGTLATWRAEVTGCAVGSREVRCTLRGANGPVDVVVSVVAPLPDPLPLPPAVAPARLMYSVRAADSPSPPRTRGEEVFKRLDPATGGSWQYELQQLRFANARLEEEVAELERAEAEREATKEREREGMRERERERARARIEQRRHANEAGVYHLQQPQLSSGMSMQMGLAMSGRYGYDEREPPHWGYSAAAPTYQLPMKRAWDDI
ncbi:hypothetical protein C8R43DRAFT_1242342 [Mycena crocata]|nr:hypothetical protein C8R43DRAFT_1242342 [Mycena crocata]